MTDPKYGQAMSYLFSHVDVHGVASIEVQDGQIFMFKKSKLQEILGNLAPDQEEVVVFVKSGGSINDEIV